MARSSSSKAKSRHSNRQDTTSPAPSAALASTKSKRGTSTASHDAESYSAFKRQRSLKRKSEKKASQRSLERQLEIPLYILLALCVCHALSGTSSLSLVHLSAHLPHSIQKLLPAWSRRLPNLAPYASDVPNASHDSKTSLLLGSSLAGLVGGSNVGQAGPFRSDAAGFGHPLTALHTFTRACLGLSYAIRPAGELTDDAAAAAAYASGLSYPAQPEPWAWLVGQPGTMYHKGLKDALYAATWVLIWTALRAAVITYILVPLGTRWVTKPKLHDEQKNLAITGARRLRRIKVWEKNIMRFAEQSWCVIFYIVNLSVGLHIAYHSDYWFNPAGFWTGSPHVELQGIVKFYYLTQCGYWFHMLIVIQVEAKRKDHSQMFTHHIVTILLLVGSYASHYTRVGNAVLCLMDPSDILLSLGKCLRYAGLQTLCDATFGAFLLCWVVLRHFLYMILVWSCIETLPKDRFEVAKYPSREAWETRESIPATDPLVFKKIHYSPLSVSEFFASDLDFSRSFLVALLVVLQFLLLTWFVMIVRVAYRVVTGGGAADSRSDEELSEEDEKAIEEVEVKEKEKEMQEANKKGQMREVTAGDKGVEKVNGSHDHDKVQENSTSSHTNGSGRHGNGGAAASKVLADNSNVNGRGASPATTTAGGGAPHGLSRTNSTSTTMKKKKR
ncbi:LAG1-domain-containing protein [Microstroma glucosiphilum]|uniref:LAG1-domain-containing protein n=1 Tax=Pseudomicrostroma glucosiphilum TaxID=1684307 RepID=A0A316UAU0_9BASI|nr:LAG1-domain-containing protein [Pseudomicrostroma glucosiphilum]PWN21533.1 LAG1-domain-containing protein [Pseudomicrostroma glucosiphilum]